MQGRLALITGATSGIGEATALRLAEEGCDLVLTGRRSGRLSALKARLDAMFAGKVGVDALAFDVADRAAVGAALERLGPRAERIDILVNNAGLALGTEVAQSGDPEDWDRVIDTNVKGLMYVTRALLPAMIRRNRGDIINLGSVAGRWSYRGGAVYCASKAAVRAITEGLRLDLVGTPLRVTNIAPGMVETEFSDVRYRGDAQKAKDVYAGMTPLSARDIADTIAWCLSRPPHVNVQELIVFPTDQPAVGHVHRRS